MITWTLAQIRARVRRITGKLSVNQMTDADINDRINSFYQQQLPKKLFSPLFEGFWDYTTVAGTDEITLDNKYLALRAPFSINGWIRTLKEDPKLFFHRWPTTETFTQQEPYDALLYGRVLTLRPPPDGAYPIQAAALIAPDPLTSDSSLLLDNSWGLAVAYGAGIAILLEGGDFEAASGASQVYQSLEEEETIPGLLQLSGQRSIPRY